MVSISETYKEVFELVPRIVCVAAALLSTARGPAKNEGSHHIKRERVPCETIFRRLGGRIFRRCYRMSEPMFWKLHNLLKPYMGGDKKRKRGSTPNGDIPTSSRLSMALRWFAGGDPLDIFQVLRVTLLMTRVLLSFHQTV
ncbi:hypothetical protein IV203_038489 [Nitzschia inconspicua]|uniref:Uncharacterized protein n=1 Tax=Nitzschia inconspicua TaxID=303405 RepID=A0A9K3LQW8_9STRA|nr:hypothetical protein IV203_038489 [Nitzschia inconspicua]